MRTRTQQDGLAKVLWPQVRRAVLGLLLANPDREWHLREIARRTGTALSATQREVLALAEAGILQRRVESRRSYYRANTSCPIYPELHSIAMKTVGLADVLRGALADVPGIEVAFVHGSLARGDETSQSDVDLMVVGDVTLRALSSPLHSAQNALARPVNPSTYPVDEFRSKLAEGHYFLTRVMEEPKLFVIGDADVLDRLAPVGMGDRSQAQPPGDRRPARRR
jgi:predicted nucleotidyltransferase